MNLISKATARALSALLLMAVTIGAASAAPQIMTGAVAHNQATKLTSEIHWYQNVNSAEAEARRTGKLVFWMHMLGQLDGTT